MLIRMKDDCHVRIGETVAREIEILMYHSVSDAGGPTSIPADVFDAQIEALAVCGYHVTDFIDVIDWTTGERDLPDRTAVITFDDGFLDFRDAAWPILEKHGFTATVFLPTDRMGEAEDWEGANDPVRPLMTWDDVRALAGKGARFGSHSLTHANLPTLDDEALDDQLLRSRIRLSEELGEDVISFAPPYGATSEKVRNAIRRHYKIAAGTGFARAKRSSDIFDLPRIEMHYFRNSGLWRRYLEGKGDAYFRLRQAARTLRNSF